MSGSGGASGLSSRLGEERGGHTPAGRLWRVEEGAPQLPSVRAGWALRQLQSGRRKRRLVKFRDYYIGQTSSDTPSKIHMGESRENMRCGAKNRQVNQNKTATSATRAPRRLICR